MTDNQIIEETLRYLSDESYNYAILIDGEWGCGKTYFVKNILKQRIDEEEKNSESPRKVKYISLYGCRSIQDIQENIVWGLVDEVKEKFSNKTKFKRFGKAKSKKGASEVSSNVLLTSKKIGSILIKRAVPETNAFDIASDWLPMKSYIFIFDDIERCDCPLNEVFGFINGLVEHESAKVIFVANEKEISTIEVNEQKELQYVVVLNDKVEWPEKENPYGYSRRSDSNGKINIELLEERRKMLFPESEVDGLYRKIREKLVGVTLHYAPDAKTIAEQIIQNSNINEKLKNVLFAHMDFFASFMNTNQHHNLRTFQFFLSKISYLYIKFMEIDIDEEHREKALSFLIQDCFKWAVRFKGNIPIPSDMWRKALYEAENKSAVIKAYVETGEYKDNLFVEDIKKYVRDELQNRLAEDDPFNLLYNQYYFHEQEWCEQRLEEIKQKLDNNKYPVQVYSKLIVLLVLLEDIGFSSVHVEDIKKLMYKNIGAGFISSKIDDDLFYIESKERKQKTVNIINELNLAIDAKDKQMRQKTIEELLSDENWVAELREYIESDVYTRSADRSVFSKATAIKWIEAIQKACIGDIDVFRRWLHQTYSENVIYESLKVDLPVIKEVAEGINPEEASDLIKKTNLKWLKEKMMRIVESNM